MINYKLQTRVCRLGKTRLDHRSWTRLDQNRPDQTRPAYRLVQIIDQTRLDQTRLDYDQTINQCCYHTSLIQPTGQGYYRPQTIDYRLQAIYDRLYIIDYRPCTIDYIRQAIDQTRLDQITLQTRLGQVRLIDPYYRLCLGHRFQALDYSLQTRLGLEIWLQTTLGQTRPYQTRLDQTRPDHTRLQTRL